MKFERSEMLLGNGSIQKLNNSTVAVFGIGGVGSYTVEALARSGIGRLVLVDFDRVSKTNINRQLIALNSTVGRSKVDVARDRILDINSDAKVVTVNCRFDADNIDKIDFSEIDYIVDAIDSVSSKLLLCEIANSNNIPIISAMGAGNKLDPTMFEVDDISRTSVCPLARIMRKELKKRGIEHLKVVYSKEKAVDVEKITEDPTGRKMIPGSVSFVPSVMGLIIAGEVIKDLCNKK